MMWGTQKVMFQLASRPSALTQQQLFMPGGIHKICYLSCAAQAALHLWGLSTLFGSDKAALHAFSLQILPTVQHNIECQRNTSCPFFWLAWHSSDILVNKCKQPHQS